MAEVNPPIFMEAGSGSYYTEQFRRMLEGLMGPGVARPGHLAVTQTLTPSLGVAVAEGLGFIQGTSNAYQGVYGIEERGGTASLPITTPHASLARKDLVIARMRDAWYAGADNEWELAIIAGTPHASPARPATPASSIDLAEINVGAGAASIVNANITDLRSLARPWNVPWGILPGFVATKTSDFSGWAAGPSEMTSFQVSAAHLAGRRYRVSANLRGYGSAAANLLVQLYDSTALAVVQESSQHVSTGGADANWFLASAPLTPGAGTKVWKIRCGASAGTGTIVGGSTRPIVLTVEDIGPA
jgi:hypothetical protein